MSEETIQWLVRSLSSAIAVIAIILFYNKKKKELGPHPSQAQKDALTRMIVGRPSDWFVWLPLYMGSIAICLFAIFRYQLVSPWTWPFYGQ